MSTTGTTATTDPAWVPDFLGPAYQQLELWTWAVTMRAPSWPPLSGTWLPRRSTPRPEPAHPLRPLVERLAPKPGPPPSATAAPHAVLYIHGWADYFFQTEMAEYLNSTDIAFYALDLRKYGRSLRPHPSEGFTTDLQVYDADIDAALSAIRTDLRLRHGHTPAPKIRLMAHSLGGLIAPLWANRHPGRLASLILNGPWLELQGSRFIRQIATHLVDPFVRSDPKRVFHFPEMTAYWQSVSVLAHGSWDLKEEWRPAASFPLRAGWIKAVLNGHATVSTGLAIDAPVLMLLSEKTIIQAEWSPEMMGVDAVIDVNEMARLGLKIGHRVMVNRYSGALHDVMLSAPAIGTGSTRIWPTGCAPTAPAADISTIPS
ncbi:alpha/beta hydrolase [Pseudarthrobacter sp. P1]|uniref:alpha/beta hydrolase n=1 Tax=Pseudarthrobacter sp. P1 TaxID=3418418 RepID=UPI003CEEE55D